jgi:hypothetical protein
VPCQPMKSKVVSVSLFGTNKKYLKGSANFLQSVKVNLPGWDVFFFVGKSVPEQVTTSLKDAGAHVIHVSDKEDLSAAAWRFRVNELGSPDFVIFRDADSIVSQRESHAIGQWVDSGMTAHIIRDHPFHSAKILAGLWGLRPAEAPWFASEVEDYKFEDVYGSDQEFLAKEVYPKVVKSSMVHASFHRHEENVAQNYFTIGSSRVGVFCGEAVTERFLVRAYARLRRLIDSRSCRCKE